MDCCSAGVQQVSVVQRERLKAAAAAARCTPFQRPFIFPSTAAAPRTLSVTSHLHDFFITVVLILDSVQGVVDAGIGRPTPAQRQRVQHHAVQQSHLAVV